MAADAVLLRDHDAGRRSRLPMRAARTHAPNRTPITKRSTSNRSSCLLSRLSLTSSGRNRQRGRITRSHRTFLLPQPLGATARQLRLHAHSNIFHELPGPLTGVVEDVIDEARLLIDELRPGRGLEERVDLADLFFG